MENVNWSGHSERSAAGLAMRQAKLSSNSMLKAEDIRGTTPGAASRALSRLAKQGVLTRVGKGLYFAPKDTLIGKSRPSEAAIALKLLEGKTRLAGASAANLLGLSTQVPARPQIVAFTSSKPKFAGKAQIKLRRRSKSHALPMMEGALLELIRERGQAAEIGAGAAIQRLRTLVKGELPKSSLRALREDALEEPPRVRAILGALLAHAELPAALWEPLRKSLNPLTRFDFGLFSELPNAKEWQAK